MKKAGVYLGGGVILDSISSITKKTPKQTKQQQKNQ